MRQLKNNSIGKSRAASTPCENYRTLTEVSASTHELGITAIEFLAVILYNKHMENMKSLFRTKTFWLATAQAVVGVLAIFASAYPEVGGLMIAKSIIDVILRSYTAEPVGSLFS